MHGLARPVNNFTHLASEKLRLMRMNLLIANVLDRKRVAQIADWAAVGVAISLPWSTSATSILLVVWLMTLLPTLDVAMVRREVETAAGGLPVLLWLLAALGMLWAEVSWADRIHGLGGFHRLLVIPLLLAQFRRSKHGAWVLFGFLASAVVLLLVCWALVLARIETWPSHFISTGYWSGTALGKAPFSSYVRSVSSGLCAMRYASATGRGPCGQPG